MSKTSTKTSKINKKAITSSDVYKPVGPYSQAVLTDKTLYVSGVLGLDTQSNMICGIEGQTRQALNNLKSILEAGESSLQGVLKTTILLTSMDDFPCVNKVYAEFFTEVYPARSTFQVVKLPLNALIEIEAIALIGIKELFENISELGLGVLSELEVNVKDRTIHFLEDEGINQNKENELNKENGLSKCDTVNDIHLDRNNFHVLQNDSTTTENIEGDQSKQEDNNQINQNDTNYREQEKITTLKEVVEHVLSNNVLEKHENIEKNSSETNLSQVEVIEHETDTQVEHSIDETSSVTAPEEIKEEIEELASPSQSECSRATRWEALADMAAELPPSLTVDPITGQIYALSK